MLENEINSHLGYGKNEHGSITTDNRRSGYTNKKIKTNSSKVDIKVPSDRDSDFEPKLIPKHKKMYLKLKKSTSYVCERNASARYSRKDRRYISI